MVARSTNLWTNSELADAVEAYVFLLRLERAGLGDYGVSVTEALLAGPLRTRNEASVRYRMRNISAVVKDLDGPILKTYSPAEQVGSGVRARIWELLGDHPGFQKILQSERSGGRRIGAAAPATREEALHHLAALREYLLDLERELIGTGHNRPPEPLNTEGPDRDDFMRAHEDVRALETELEKALPDDNTVSRRSSRLVKFGMRVAHRDARTLFWYELNIECGQFSHSRKYPKQGSAVIQCVCLPALRMPSM